MPPSTRIRNDRNNPYLFDGLFGQVHRSAAGSIWRWRTEFPAVPGVAAGTGWLVHATTVTLSVLTLAGTAGLLALIPATRRYAIRRFWCLITRHRLQRLCWDARLHPRAGRLRPL